MGGGMLLHIPTKDQMVLSDASAPLALGLDP
jgi:hypothetical protein